MLFQTPDRDLRRSYKERRLGQTSQPLKAGDIGPPSYNQRAIHALTCASNRVSGRSHSRDIHPSYTWVAGILIRPRLPGHEFPALDPARHARRQCPPR